MHAPDFDFITPDPIDPLDRAWQPPPEPASEGPSWWLFGPEELASSVDTTCPECLGAGTVDGFEPCSRCAGSGNRPDWWL